MTWVRNGIGAPVGAGLLKWNRAFPEGDISWEVRPTGRPSRRLIDTCRNRISTMLLENSCNNKIFFVMKLRKSQSLNY